MSRNKPRLVIAGLCGDSGKTLVSLGLLLLAKRRGMAVRAFKKGPDYIDPAWLAWASGSAARNLDSFLMGFEGVVSAFERHALTAGLNVIEGNRGLYDGVDARGTHSTAALAVALDAPVLLVVDASKSTGTLAALVLGCQKLDPAVKIAGVVLNRVSSARHARVAREAIETACAIPVLGVLPRCAGGVLPERHLGLVPPGESCEIELLAEKLIGLVEPALDWQGVLDVAGVSGAACCEAAPELRVRRAGRIKVGCLRDAAFNFYYPENLEALEDAGAELVMISSLDGEQLPAGLGALYIGGGFPETHAAALSRNTELLGSIRAAASAGLPIWAECGGLMLLSQGIEWKGARYPMAGVLPVVVEMFERPQGHGYSVLQVDSPNPFFAKGTELRGHEFHYSKIAESARPPTACVVKRGTGCYEGRDGITVANVWAGYTHLHASGAPQWAPAMLQAAARFIGNSDY